MLVTASPWHAAHDFPLLPAVSAHSFPPRSTHSMPGLAKSSACSLRTLSPANSMPDLSGAGRDGSAENAEKLARSSRADADESKGAQRDDGNAAPERGWLLVTRHPPLVTR